MHDLTPDQAAFYERFLAIGDNREKYAGRRVVHDRFGDSPQMSDDLLALVLAGTKTASCSCRWEWEAGGDEPLGPGTLGVITDGSDTPRCILETVELVEVPFTQVTEEHAYLEGEGDRSLAYWRKAHTEWFERSLARIGRELTDDAPILCERFLLLWAPDGAGHPMLHQ
ncbi:MAG: ASCH domain-containing protein [Planctomycetota bacterium]